MSTSTDPSALDLDVLEFPCLIEVKIFFLNNDKDEQVVKSLVDDHIDAPYLEAWRCKPSKAGKYLAATAAVRAQSRVQMDGLYQSLSAHDKVIMAI